MGKPNHIPFFSPAPDKSLNPAPAASLGHLSGHYSSHHRLLLLAFVSRLQPSLCKIRSVGGNNVHLLVSLLQKYLATLSPGRLHASRWERAAHSTAEAACVSANNLQSLPLPAWRWGGGVIWCPRGHLVLVLRRLGQRDDFFSKAVCGIWNGVKQFHIWGCIFSSQAKCNGFQTSFVPGMGLTWLCWRGSLKGLQSSFLKRKKNVSQVSLGMSHPPGHCVQGPSCQSCYACASVILLSQLYPGSSSGLLTCHTGLFISGSGCYVSMKRFVICFWPRGIVRGSWLLYYLRLICVWPSPRVKILEN